MLTFLGWTGAIDAPLRGGSYQPGYRLITLSFDCERADFALHWCGFRAGSTARLRGQPIAPDLPHPRFRRRIGCLLCAIALGWFAAHARAAEPAYDCAKQVTS
jgi:hypothetical protein